MLIAYLYLMNLLFPIQTIQQILAYE